MAVASSLILHRVLNPGIAFNEVVSGKRIPKVQFICTTAEGSRTERLHLSTALLAPL